MKRAVREAVEDETGASAVELALIAPAFFALLMGIIHASLLVFTVASMNFAVEKGARCASVNSTACGDATSIAAYAADNYYAPGASPTFTYATPACGKSLTATLTYTLSVVLYETSIPLSATACFP